MLSLFIDGQVVLAYELYIILLLFRLACLDKIYHFFEPNWHLVLNM
ncbi:hypothetical protein DSUL_60093 [Desulfovibrionales bacterium]